MNKIIVSVLFSVVLSLTCHAEKAVTITVDAGASQGPLQPIWAWFGYDEPNYTYMRDGKKLLGEIAAIGKEAGKPVYIRTHNLLTTGNGQGERKWGSTNAYTEDENGNPVYDWTIVDRIMDTYLGLGLKPLVEMGFMPEALSTHPQPYKHNWSTDGALWSGWAYPPTDYEKWGELIYQWVKHSLEKYGAEEVETWLWEPWNEPNIGYWQGTYEEFIKLYDYSADAVKRACPKCLVGGPHTTNPDSEKAKKYLRDFLQHCADGKNSATGENGAPLDFIAFHAKGNPQMRDGHIRMNMSPQLKAVKNGFEIVSSFEKFKDLPVLIGEFDPEGCAACSIQEHPQYAYRNGTMYPVYTAASQARLHDLAAEYRINLIGAVTWGFEFENERYFDGFRDLATNGIDKPVLNVFRMYGLIPSEKKVTVTSSRDVSVDDIIANGVNGESADIHGLAGMDDSALAVMIWNYHDDDVPAKAEKINLLVKNLSTNKVRLAHYRVDTEHSNSFEVWKAMGSPQHPTAKQVKQLELAGQLDQLGKVKTHPVKDGKVQLEFELPRQGVSLVKLEFMK